MSTQERARELARLKELLAGPHTRLPWVQHNKHGIFGIDELGRFNSTICWTALNNPTRKKPENEANAALIVAAVNALPYLLDSLAELERTAKGESQ